MIRRILLLCLFLASSVSAQPQTAAQTYLAYRAAFEKATSLEALRPFMAGPALTQLDAVPASERPKVFDLIKSLNAAYQVHVTAETDTPDGHILIVDGVDAGDRPIRGTVELKKEPSGWKIVGETWTHH